MPFCAFSNKTLPISPRRSKSNIANKYLYKFGQEIITKPANQVDLSPAIIDELPPQVVANIGTLLSTNKLRKRVILESKLADNPLALCSILHIAMTQKDSEITKLAKEKLDKIPLKDLALQDENGDTALIVAANNGHIDIAKALIEKMDPKDLALQAKNGNTALILAANNGHIDIVKALIAKMHHTDLALRAKKENTAIMVAASEGHTYIAEELIKKMRPQDLALQEQNKNTALMIAAFNRIKIQP